MTFAVALHTQTMPLIAANDDGGSASIHMIPPLSHLSGERLASLINTSAYRALLPLGTAGAKALALAMVTGGRERTFTAADTALIDADRTAATDTYSDEIDSNQMQQLGLAIVGQLLRDGCSRTTDAPINGDAYGDCTAFEDARFYVSEMASQPATRAHFDDVCSIAGLDSDTTLTMLGEFFAACPDAGRSQLVLFG